MISDCSFNLFLRHSSRIKKAKDLLINNKYLDLNKDSVLTYFGATITSFDKIDGRSTEHKSLNYFTVEEALKNFREIFKINIHLNNYTLCQHKLHYTN